MIKEILNSFTIAKKFEANTNSSSSTFKKEKTVKVKITEDQIKILEYCAMMGITNSERLKGQIKIKYREYMNSLRKEI